MALTRDFPRINPIQLYQQSDVLNTGAYTQASYASFDPNYNSRNMDKDFLYRNLKEWQEKHPYFQKWQQGDVIRPQWLGYENYITGPTNTYVLRVIDMDGNIVKTVNSTAGTILAADVQIREAEIPLWDLPEGKYAVQMHKVGILTDYDFFFLSEGLDIKQKHKDTVLLEYSHSVNDQGIFWETGIKMMMRVEGCLVELQPQSKFNVYENQPLDLELLSATPYREWQLVFTKPLPLWMTDKLERILDCNTLYADGLQITRIEGSKLDLLPAEKSAFSTAKITVREKSNDHALQFPSFPAIILGDAPTEPWFSIEAIEQTTPSTTWPIQKYFSGAINFVNFLNSTKFLGIDPRTSYFAISSNNKIVLITNDATIYADFGPGLTMEKVCTNYLILDLLTTAAEDKQEVYFDSSDPTYYAYFWNDGIAANIFATNTTSTDTNSYPVGKFKAFFFWSNKVQNITISGSTSATEKIITGIEGLLGPIFKTLYCTGNIVKTIKNNFMAKVGGTLRNVFLGGNYLVSAEVNKMIIWAYEAEITGAWGGSSALEVWGMENENGPAPAPPALEPGLRAMITHLKNAGVTVTVDP